MCTIAKYANLNMCK